MQGKILQKTKPFTYLIYFCQNVEQSEILVYSLPIYINRILSILYRDRGYYQGSTEK